MEYIKDNDMADFLNNLGRADMQSFINILQAYIDHAFNINIEYYGFNTSSGNVFLELDNGVCIASCFGRSVDYILTDQDGEEIEFTNYRDALDYQEDNI